MHNDRVSGPTGYIMNMLLFIAVIGVIVWYFSPWSVVSGQTLLVDSFNANRALNGLILVVLFIGVIFNLRRALTVGPAAKWLNAYLDTVDPNRTRLPNAPGLIKAMARMLLQADKNNERLTATSTRAILDSLDQRIDEGRELAKYMSNLLVFLGLLGTFWGLLQTVDAVANVISSLSNTEGTAEDAIGQLIANLEEPLSGMGTAFSSSLFGLGGSLIVGFLDIQAGQAQNRFYSDVEDWLSTYQSNPSANVGQQARMSDDHMENMVHLLANIDANIRELNQGENDSAQEIKSAIHDLGRTLVEGKPLPKDKS